MRRIANIVIHCTATAQNTSVASIQRFWKVNLKWSKPGYHYIILKNGTVQQLSPIEQPTNGVANHNANSIHIAYIGGVDAANKPIDNRTDAQKASMLRIVNELKAQFPNAQVLGHRDFPRVAKACPSFDAKQEFNSINNA